MSVKQGTATAATVLRTSALLRPAHHAGRLFNANRATLPLHRRNLSGAASTLSSRAAYKQVQIRCLSSTPARRAKELPPRSEKFKKLTEEDIAAFKEITTGVMSIVDGAKTSSEDDLVPFNEDWMCVIQFYFGPDSSKCSLTIFARLLGASMPAKRKLSSSPRQPKK